MNTLHLKYAVEVEKAGSITQAADNLYMGQPNLSKAIKELEDSLGIVIFKRTSKGMVPTKIGAEFLKYAKNVLTQIQEIEALGKKKDSNSQCFSVSIPRVSYIASGFTNFISELEDSNEIDIRIEETNAIHAIHNIVEGHSNIGIIRYHSINENYFVDFLKEKSLKSELIWEFEYLAVMSKKHPLANVKNIGDKDLENYIEILHGDSNIPYLGMEEFKRSNSKDSSKKIYVYDRSTQYDLLTTIPTTYMWVSPIPDEWLNRYDLVQRKCIISNHRYKDVLIYPKNYKLEEIDKKFINKVYESKNQMAFKDYY